MDIRTFQLATGCTAARASIWAQPLTLAIAEFGIDTPRRQAMFLAQAGHESMGFARVVEIWGPTPAQAGYEGRADLGNTEPGDGSLYRGRGLLQITGRANYAACGTALGVDLVSSPRLLEGETLAARSAGWFWRLKGLNTLADADDIERATRRINGGLNGIDDRRLRWQRACAALGA